MKRQSRSLPALAVLAAVLPSGCAGLSATPSVKQQKQQAWNDERAALKFQLAGEELKRGNVEAAIKLASEVVALAPRSAEHGVLLARAHLAKGDFAAARSVLQAVRAADPDDAAAAYWFGVICERAQDWLGAVTAYRDAATADPESLEYRLALVSAAAQTGNFVEAQQVLDAGAERFALEPRFHVARAEVCRLGADLAGAVLAYERALALDPEDHETRGALGLCLFWQGQAERAVNTLEPLRERVELSAPAMDAYAAGLLALGRTNEATAALTRFLMQRPDAGPLWLTLAKAQLAAGTPAAARRAAETAARLLPESADARLLVGSVCLQLADYPAAQASAELALRRDPRDADAWLLLARVCQAAGHAEDARAAAQAALTVSPNDSDARALLTALARPTN